jgi:hypothetical protein
MAKEDAKMKNKYIVFLSLALVCTFSAPRTVQSKSDPTLVELRKQIVITNLMNALELTTAQKDTIISLIRRARDYEQQFSKVVQPHHSDGVTTYQNILKQVQTGQWALSPSVRRRFREYKFQVQKAEREYHRKIDQLIDRIKKTLRPEQIYILETFKPCIIPHISSGRIGQADQSKGWAHHLDRIYHMSDRKYFRRKDKIIRQWLKKIPVRFAVGYSAESDHPYQILSESLDHMRRLSATDYVVQRAQIIEDLRTTLLKKPPISQKTRNIDLAIKKFFFQSYTAQFLSQS